MTLVHGFLLALSSRRNAVCLLADDKFMATESIGHDPDCGNATENGGANTTFTDCNMACTGNSSEICGGPDRLDLFWNGHLPPPPPITLPSFGLWESLGCYKYEGSIWCYP